MYFWGGWEGWSGIASGIASGSVGEDRSVGCKEIDGEVDGEEKFLFHRLPSHDENVGTGGSRHINTVRNMTLDVDYRME